MTVIYETKPGRYIIQRGEVEIEIPRIGTEERVKAETVNWYDYAACDDCAEAIGRACALANMCFPDRFRVIDTWGDK